MKLLSTIKVNCKSTIYLIIILILSSKLYAQPDMEFQFEKSSKSDTIILSEINIRFPNGNIVNVPSDSDSLININKINFFNETGEYGILVRYKYSLLSDSIEFNFNINGRESIIKIKVSFNIGTKFIEKNGKWIKGHEISKGHISVIRFYNSIEGVSVQKLNIESSEYYKGPFFELTNNSNDTLYGEYLPGYFWGKLFIGNSDPTWNKELIGNLDLNFVKLLPLYPDSNRIATVGSFGLFKELPKGLYKYELLYSLNGNSHFLSKYVDVGDIEWWTNIADFYKIDYVFINE